MPPMSNYLVCNFFGEDLKPFLCSGIMLASFQSFGTVPSCSDLLNISVSEFFIFSRVSNNSFG